MQQLLSPLTTICVVPAGQVAASEPLAVSLNEAATIGTEYAIFTPVASTDRRDLDPAEPLTN
jgi:hypothetical protein